MEQRYASGANVYSPTWFELFLPPPDLNASRTAEEVAFLQRVLLGPKTESVLDLCCGYGRHAKLLAEAGYRVLGIDRDAGVISRAESSHRLANLAFRVHDMTQLHILSEQFDAVVCLWQSFGYFDADTNQAILKQIGERIRPGGRVVLDIYNGAFFDRHKGVRVIQQLGEQIVTRQEVENDRLNVSLDYSDRNEVDLFSWQIYTPETIVELAEACGLANVLICSGFCESTKPSSDEPRMQAVLERPEPD